MPLKINEPIILADSQDISVTSINIFKTADHWEARVFYSISGSDGKSVTENSLVYTGDDFNTWWGQFTSGVFLYSEYIQKKKLSIPLPDKIEDDFKNIAVVEAIPVDGVIDLNPLPQK